MIYRKLFRLWKIVPLCGNAAYLMSHAGTTGHFQKPGHGATMAARVPVSQKMLSCDADVARTTSASLNLQAACLDDRNARFVVASEERGSDRFPVRP
jgi:hypothetical protein